MKHNSHEGLLNQGLPPSHYKRAKGFISHEKQLGKSHWQRRAVQTILHDRVYVGDMVQGKVRVVNHQRVAVRPNEWVCVANTHKPLISRELFERVQTRLQEDTAAGQDSRNKAVPYTPHMLKEKVFCAHCGQPMHRHRQNKDGTYWYRCESQWKVRKDFCFQVSVKEKDLLVGIFALLSKHAEVILGEYIQKERTRPLKDAASEVELRKINNRLANSAQFLKSLYENMLNGLITSEEFTSMKIAYETEIDALAKRSDEIRALRREEASGFESYRWFSKAVFDALTNHELTTDILGLLVEKVLVSRDKSFEIILRFRDEFQEGVKGMKGMKGVKGVKEVKEAKEVQGVG